MEYKAKKTNSFTTRTLLVQCPECKKFVDLGSKNLEVYNTAFAFLLNVKCPYCGIIFDEKDTCESDYRVLDFEDF